MFDGVEMNRRIKLNRGREGLVTLHRGNRKVSVTTKSKYYMSDIILQKRILVALKKKKPKGITASQLSKELGVHHQTIMSILETLVALREAYDIKYGGMKVFFPNGKLNYSANFQDVKFRDKTYSFCEIIQYLTGHHYIFIQEKEPDQNNILEPKGGLLLKEDDLDFFIENV